MDKLTIDLNCDMGEGCGNDAELMRFVSSANIACGYHAGDRDTMRRTVDLALEHAVAIGAHPGYADRENFGRAAMNVSIDAIKQLVTDQVVTLKEIADAAGAIVTHVKPHGALYNQAARDSEMASAIAEAVAAIDRQLILFGLSGSASIGAARAKGLRAASEVFADRTYQNDASLTPRSRSNALIAETDAAIAQVLDMIKYGRVRSTDGLMVNLTAETVCLHGDGAHAVDFARAINTKLAENGIRIAALSG